MPEISVVMPVYNAQAYLYESIESILNQSYQDFEFIIINDGSTDESKNVIHSFHDKRIIYLQHNNNKGITYALNYGLSVARGNFIARMDADDVAMPNRLLMQLLFLQRSPHIHLAGSYIKINFKNKVLIKKFPKYPKNIRWRLIKSIPLAHPAVMFRKSLLSHGDYVYDAFYFPCEDYHLWCRLALKYNIANIPLPLLSYRQHPQQVSATYRTKQIQTKNKISRLYTARLFQISNQNLLNKCHAFFNGRGRQTVPSVVKIFTWLALRAVKIKGINRGAFLLFITQRFFKNLSPYKVRG